MRRIFKTAKISNSPVRDFVLLYNGIWIGGEIGHPRVPFDCRRQLRKHFFVVVTFAYPNWVPMVGQAVWEGHCSRDYANQVQ